MNAAGVIVALIIFVAGVYVGQRASLIPQRPKEEEQQVLSEEVDQQDPEETLSPTPTAPPAGGPTAIPTNTPVPLENDRTLSSFKYPNSSVVSSPQGSLKLESNDSADNITDWYKEKIKGQGMSVTSFVTTKTNDNVLNKLVGADGQKEIRVEIKKSTGSSLVEIEVSLKTTS